MAKKELPWQVQSIIDQMGGLGLRGGFVYMGASQFLYNVNPPDAEKGLIQVNADGTIRFDVGLMFKVNLKGTWKIVIGVDTNDTYTVILWRKASKEEQEQGLIGVVVEKMEEVYCEQLQSCVEEIYDRAVRNYQNGLIYIS